MTSASSCVSIHLHLRGHSMAARATIAALGLVATVGLGCSGAESPTGPAAVDPVEAPVEAAPSPSSTPAGPAGDVAGEDTPATPTTAAPSAASPPTRANPPPPTLAEIDAVLLRYDEVATRLAADPIAVSDPAHPVRVEWAALVPAGSMLSSDVIRQLVTAPAAAGTRLVPGPDGLSYRHRALTVGLPLEGTLEFTWCGYSPGIRVDTASGAVVDDAVAYVHGSGRLRSGPDGWMIESLDQLSLEVHAPGSPDPCPAEQAGSGGSESRGSEDP